MSPGYVELFYLVATALFIFSLHWMNDPKTARRGVAAGAAAMFLGVAATWAQPFVVNHGWMVLAVVLGIAVGYPLSRVALTAAPQRTALSHAFGGLAAALVGTGKYYLWLSEGPEELTTFRMVAIIAEVILGCITFTGSLFAAGKLQELRWIPQRPVTYPLQNVFNIALLLVAVGIGTWLALNPATPEAAFLFPVVIVIALMFGILLIVPIGGADMPTVIAILNSYAGLAAVAMGFVLENNLLITAGALDGASGLILSIIMCKAMNRSYLNVLFGAFGSAGQTAAQEEGEQGEYKADTPQSAALIMEQSTNVVIIPGYGMAVAQAQHRVRELYDHLKKRGVTVRFAIHPVAGRMPGHMNVLLAEADVPYGDLVEMDDVNRDMPQCDVALVIGANDVVNPAAALDDSSPIYGMPIIEARKARTIFAIKRSMNPGFAGIENALYFDDKTWMLFGDAKHVVGEIVKELSGDAGTG
ncbi:MAG: NAD(P)(+) transhydrogenase (Re/Si-specific) subunit beta [Gammaproteobacteria bacterium]|nr:NAD(P)(+) transhydrogenase (Re/Si-specific) subunit beta [Gammaproteobacteria bacterium]